MMNFSKDQKQIGVHLGIRPINHGEVYTFQIAVPESDQQHLPRENYENIQKSLQQHKSNLIPLIVRRTQAYNEDQEYEVIYGVDWYLVAKEIGIERLWVWVFELTDEQAITLKQEMEFLTTKFGNYSIQDQVKDNFKREENKYLVDIQQDQPENTQLVLRSFAQQIEEVLQAKLEKLEHLFNQRLTQLEAHINPMIKGLAVKIDQLENSLGKIETSSLTERTKTIPIAPVEEMTKTSDFAENRKERTDYSKMKLQKLKELAKKRQLRGYSSLNKNALISLHTSYDQKTV